MDENLLNKEIKEELKYRLILARYSEDDPITEAHMLKALKEKYEEHNVKMSDKMKEHFKVRTLEIAKSLKEKINRKKEEIEKLSG